MSTELDYIQIPTWQRNRRLETIPLPTKIKSVFVATCERWLEHSGAEWTNSRLKSFRDCLMQSWASGKVLTSKPAWFKTTPCGNLSGVFGTLFRIAMTSDDSLKHCLNLLQWRTSIRKKAITIDQENDIRKSVTSDPVCTKHLSRKVFGAVGRMRIPRVKTRKPVPLLQVLPGKRAHVQQIPRDLELLMDGDMYHRNYTVINQAIGSSWKGPDLSNPTLEEYEYYQQMGLMNPHHCVGEINVTLEPGLKTRYFAAPNVVLQRALEPLKEALIHLLKHIPWDCTLDQRKADPAIQTQLRRGKTVYSVDLSAATDHFPWSFQETVLRAVTHRKGYTRKIRALMIDICETGQWRPPLRGRSMKWSKGQALGLGPSFPLFTISHGILLYLLNNQQWDRQFYVCGDDVVIFNEDLHSKYRKVLSEWQIPISESKSFASSHFAQFTGVNYTRKKSWWLPKWNEFTRENLLDAAAWWYPGLTKGMKDHKLITWVLSLPEPYGLGRNPLGVPLDTRLPQWVVDAVEREKSARDERSKASNSRVTRNRLISKLDLDDRTRYWWWSLLKEDTNTTIRPESSLLELQSILRDGTEIPGYPSTRLLNDRKDPYTKGRTTMWKRILKSQPPESMPVG